MFKCDKIRKSIQFYHYNHWMIIINYNKRVVYYYEWQIDEIENYNNYIWNGHSVEIIFVN